MKRLGSAFKKYFIPHEGNGHQPHLLRPRSVVFVLVIALAIELLFWIGATELAPRSRLFGVILVNALVDGTNANRLANAIPSLHVSPLLQAAAQEKANDMAANNYFAHTSPSGITPWYWFDRVGYSYASAGENLAVNFSDSQDVTNAWMNSPGHRANILNADFSEIGMATASGTFNGHPAIYVVELFGSPAPALPAPIVVTRAIPPPARPSVPKAPVATVKGAETRVATSGLTVAGSTDLENKESNPVQAAAASPRGLIDEIYLAVIALFALALGITIFVKIRIQHPQVIFGGMIVLLVAGLFIVLNQHLLAGAAVL